MQDLFGNQKPVQIEVNEWWFNGRIIQKQKDFRLPYWISFSDDSKNYFVEFHSNKEDAISFAIKNPCLNPSNFPHNYIGGIKKSS